MKKRMNKRRELQIRYWGVFGALPPENPFCSYQPFARRKWYRDLEEEISDAELQRHLLGNNDYDPGP